MTFNHFSTYIDIIELSLTAIVWCRVLTSRYRDFSHLFESIGISLKNFGHRKKVCLDLKNIGLKKSLSLDLKKKS